MILISHRRNTSEQVRDTPHEYGIEFDIRNHGDELLVHHDPYAEGERVQDWLKHYRHRLLILNVKEEGLEQRLIALMREHGIEDYFFLDQSFPFLLRTANGGEARCAVRLSEYEPVETALALADRVQWVWVDCFTRFPLDREQADRLHAAGLRICLASPELHGHAQPHEIPELRAYLAEQGIAPDAVCTKHPDRWQ